MGVRSRRRYQILEILGAGATATVAAARDPTGHRVALKVLREGFHGDRDTLSRLRDEARMLHRLDHPHIVTVEGLLQIDGRPVVIMEWVDGLSLRDLLDGGVPVEVAVAMARDIADALDAAYNRPATTDDRPMRIVHRDVKPAHILLSVDGTVKLTDFGIAKGEFADREAVSLAMVHGSRGYQAPERLDGTADTPAVDVYALGLSLFEAITGKPMVVSRHHERHDRAIDRHLEHLQPAGLPPRATEALRELVRRMSRYEPEERPAPSEAALALTRWLVRADRHPDLPGFASRRVAPVRAERAAQDPRQHPAWEQVAFLHDPPLRVEDEEEATQVIAGTLPGEVDLDEMIQQRLSRPDWATRVGQFEPLLRHRDDWSVQPLLAVVDRALLPWWNFWSRPAPTAQVAAALRLLRHRPEPAVLRRARRLADAPAPEVADAARRVLRAARAREAPTS